MPAPLRLADRQGMLAVQRVVHFENGCVPDEMLEVSQQRPGQRVSGKQTLVQLRRRGVGDHRPPYLHGVAVGGAHRDRTSAFHVDAT